MVEGRSCVVVSVILVQVVTLILAGIQGNTQTEGAFLGGIYLCEELTQFFHLRLISANLLERQQPKSPFTGLVFWVVWLKACE